MRKLERSRGVKWEEQKELTGIYSGNRIGKNQDGKDVVIHDFKREDGSVGQFYGTVVLNDYMSRIKVNDKFKIVYIGKEGRTKLFDVFVE